MNMLTSLLTWYIAKESGLTAHNIIIGLNEWGERYCKDSKALTLMKIIQNH